MLGSVVKNLPAMQETWVPFLGWEDTLEKGIATQSSILAQRILLCVATAEFSRFTVILSAALSQHYLSGFEIAQLEFHHLH